MFDNTLYRNAVSWLIDLKNSVIETKGEPIKFRTGYLAIAYYIDTILQALTSQQTKIAEIKSMLEIEKTYSAAWGEFMGFTPQEMTLPEQMELKKYMEPFAKKWKEKYGDSEGSDSDEE